MTFSELKNMVAYYLDDLNFGYFTETQVELWLNNAQKEVNKRLIRAGQNYYLKCSQTDLVVNQRDYVLPSDFKKINRLELIISGSPPNEAIQPIMPITLNQQNLVSTTTGQPQFYFLKKNRISLQPAPDTTLVMRMYYSYGVQDMSSASDEPDVPVQYHELIALLAAQDGFIKDGRPSELLNLKLGIYKNDLDQDTQERAQDFPRTVVETGGDDEAGYYW